MRATVMYGAGDVRVEDVPDPTIKDPTDAILRVTRACICGSDLWPYKAMQPDPGGARMGHEFIGVVEDVGADVQTLSKGDVVVAPFAFSDGTCDFCVEGLHTSCRHGGFWGSGDVDGGQGEAVRVPFADGTLVKLDVTEDDALMPSLLTLSDVFATGHHAAISAGVIEGMTVAVVGDGAVGLCGVLAARELGAERIIAMSRHAPRQEVARRFGATDVVEERDKEGVARVLDLTDGIGADAVLECVGTDSAMKQALRSARPGAMVGYVGVPHGVNLPINAMFGRNVGVAGGMAPVRKYLPDLLERTLSGRADAGAVFDATMPLDDVAEAYAAMDERRAIKVLLTP